MIFKKFVLKELNKNEYDVYCGETRIAMIVRHVRDDKNFIAMKTCYTYGKSKRYDIDTNLITILNEVEKDFRNKFAHYLSSILISLE